MKVLVVSQHELLGRSLAIMFQHHLADYDVEVRVSDAASVGESIRDWHADVAAIEAIVDFPSGLSILRTVLSELENTPVLMLGVDNNDASICAGITAGADGYASQDVSPQALAATVVGMTRGQLGLTRSAALGVVRRLRTMARVRPVATVSEAGAEKLTQREREVFELVKQGKRSKDIAEDLCIAEGTVYKHIQNILDKLHAHSRTHAIFVSESSAPV